MCDKLSRCVIKSCCIWMQRLCKELRGRRERGQIRKEDKETIIACKGCYPGLAKWDVAVSQKVLFLPLIQTAVQLSVD